MTELLTAAQMREVEQAAINAGLTTGLAMMEQAGQAVIDAMQLEWPKLRKKRRRACILCGPGNNGGDGFVIARLLAAQGWELRTHLFGDPERMPSDARANHDRWAADHPVLPLTPDDILAGPRPEVIIDAVFGTGLTRPLPDTLAAALDDALVDGWQGGGRIRKVAVDCPSGLNLDTGEVPGLSEQGRRNSADLTVTFHCAKLGQFLGHGSAFCGKLTVADIGLQSFDTERAMIGTDPDRERVRLVEPVHAGQALPADIWPGALIAKHHAGGHKFDHGHVLVFSGGVGKGGAARMAARAALRAGAGLVTLICPPAALIENACHLDAIMLRALDRDAPLEKVADHRVSAFVMGPGMGVSDTTRARVISVLRWSKDGTTGAGPAVVLDADALTSFADAPETLFAEVTERTVLTPHEGEFARLFPDLAPAQRGDLSKVEAVRQAAARAGAIILLKGPDTVIAEPGGGVSVHATAYGREVPWLATAGAGDVLAGIIAGLAAPRTSASLFAAAELGAYLHAECARHVGPGLIAEDLPDALPAVFRKLGL